MLYTDLVVGLLTLLIGIAFCFAGYHFFRILIAVWGFLAGFLLTAQTFAVYAGGHFLVSAFGLIIAVLVGLIVAALAYYLYVAAVVILSASVGFWIGTGLMTAAVILAILTLALDLTKWLIIISTSLGGASTILAGVLLLFRVIPLDYLSLGVVGAFIRGSLLWGLVWLVLAIAGIIVQVSNTQHYEKGYAQSQF